jgi:hypothetical protein
MFSTNVLIDRLISELGYTVLQAPALDSNQQDINSLPTLYVGYVSIHRIPQVPIDMDYFNQHGEDIIQVFEVKIVTDMDNLIDVWRKTYTAINGYTPILSNTSTASVSGFAFISSDTVEANDKVIDVSRWAIGFPSTNVIL